MIQHGYTWDVDSTQHVVYRGTDGHIHELWFSSATATGTTTTSPTRPAPLPPRAIQPATPGTSTAPNTSSTAAPTATSTNCGLAAPLGNWNHNDLTNATGAPAAASDPAGYTWDVDNTQHVVYRGTDGHIHELWFSSARNWNHNDLTNATGAPAAASDPAGYTWDVDRTQHVVYRGTDGHIHELWFSSATWNWNHNDLTNATGAPAAASDPAGYTWDVDKTQHVVSRGIDGHIHELWFSLSP